MKLWHKGLIGAALVLALPFGATAVFGGTNDAAPKVRSIDLSGVARVDGGGSVQRQVDASPSPSESDDTDISGPCDEAEHANDPRCTGAGDDGDNSGPGSGDDVDGREEDDDDNSGPGSDDDDDDDDTGDSGSGSSNSGSGSDNSGSGSSGGNSGPG